MTLQLRDSWSPAYVSDLPDSAFLFIAPGGKKDSSGKTMPRSLRYFPVRDASGKIDEPHVANALARIPQASSLTADQRAAAMTKAKALAKKTNVGGDKGEYTGDAGSGRSREALPAEFMGMQTRSFDFALELRSDGDGRTVIGRAVPYGETAQLPGNKSERFVMGAFDRQIAAGQLHTVKLHGSHTQRISGDFPIGKTVALSEQTDGLHGAWELYDTARGNEALHLVKTGEVSGFSVGFRAVSGGTRIGADGAYERHIAHLDHVVLTTSPVYQGAQVMAVRDQSRTFGGFKTSSLQAHRILDRVIPHD